jgi:hypothetical protein
MRRTISRRTLSALAAVATTTALMVAWPATGAEAVNSAPAVHMETGSTVIRQLREDPDVPIAGTAVDANTRVGLATFGSSLYVCFEQAGTIYVGSQSLNSAGPVGTSTTGCSLASWNGTLYVAWTNTSGYLEIAKSTNGVTWPVYLTLPQTSDHAPAIYQNGAGTSLDIAWRGLDSAHHLNIGVSNSTVTSFTYYELPDTTAYSPSITAFEGHLYLVWAGTNSSHNLNIVQFTAVPTYSCKYTFAQTSPYGPAIGWNTTDDYLFLAWVGGDADHTLNVSAGPDFPLPGSTGCDGIPDLPSPTLPAYTGFTGGLGRDGATGNDTILILGANPDLGLFSI